jgi:glycine cleavage system transcriptional repressor
MDLIISGFGPDKKGIVEIVSDNVLKFGYNIGESRMVILGDHFSLLMLISGLKDNMSKLEKALSAISDLRVVLQEVNPRKATHDFLLYKLVIMGPDTPGIVHAVTSYLTSNGANVASLESSISRAPHSGTEVFRFQLEIEIPVALNIRTFKEGLLTVCDALNLDVDIESAI